MNEMMRKGMFFILVAVLFSACQETLEEKAKRECEEYTFKNCPSPVEGSQDMWLDSMVFDKDSHTFKRYFRMTGALDNEEAFGRVDIREKLIDELRNTTSAHAYKDAGYNFAYYCRSGSEPDKILLEITLTPEDYRQQK